MNEKLIAIHTESGVATMPSHQYRDLDRSILSQLMAKNGGKIPHWILPYASAMQGINKAKERMGR